MVIDGPYVTDLTTLWHLRRMGIHRLACPPFSTHALKTHSTPFMEKSQQWVIISDFALKGRGARKIQKEVTDTFGSDISSRAQISRWLARFSRHDIFCLNQVRPGRPLSILGWPLEHFLEKFPFSSARIMAMHFNVSHSTVKDVVSRELGLRKILPKMSTMSALRPPEKVMRRHLSPVTCAAGSIFWVAVRRNWNRWRVVGLLCYWIRLEVCTAARWSDSKAQSRNFNRKSLITMFFTARQWTTLDVLSRRQKYNQNVLFRIYFRQGWMRSGIFLARKSRTIFYVHGQLNVSQWGSSCRWTMSPEDSQRSPFALLAKHQSALFLDVRTFEREIKGSPSTTPTKILTAVQELWIPSVLRSFKWYLNHGAIGCVGSSKITECTFVNDIFLTRLFHRQVKIGYGLIAFRPPVCHEYRYGEPSLELFHYEGICRMDRSRPPISISISRLSGVSRGRAGWRFNK
jgi:hypothetical protein